MIACIFAWQVRNYHFIWLLRPYVEQVQPFQQCTKSIPINKFKSSPSKLSLFSLKPVLGVFEIQLFIAMSGSCPI